MPVSITAYSFPLGGLLGIGLSIYLARLAPSHDPGPPEIDLRNPVVESPSRTSCRRLAGLRAAVLAADPVGVHTCAL